MVTHIYSLVTITLVHSTGKCVVLLQYILEPPPMTSAIIDRRAADSDRYIKLEPGEMCRHTFRFTATVQSISIIIPIAMSAAAVTWL